MAPSVWPGTRKYFSLIILAGLLSVGLSIPPAMAFDLFGLLGGSDEAPPPPNADTLPYAVDFAVVGNDRNLVQTLKDASTLRNLRSDPPPDADSLVRRAEADLPRLVDALWGAGYYNVSVIVTVAGVPLSLRASRPEAAVRAAAGYRSRALVPVQVRVDPGTQFVLRSITVLDARTGRPVPPEDLPRITGLKPGDPARGADILAAEARIVDHFRAQSRPFANVTRRDPVVIHPSQVMDISLTVDPGPRAGIGGITIRGLENVDPSVVRSFIYTDPGDPYSPAVLASMRKSILRIEALSSVRIREGDTLDAYRELPLFIDITERPPRVIGASAQYSTIDGPALRAYWAHRDLFGGAERLSLEGSLFYLTENGGHPDRDEDLRWNDLEAASGRAFSSPLSGEPAMTFLPKHCSNAIAPKDTQAASSTERRASVIASATLSRSRAASSTRKDRPRTSSDRSTTPSWACRFR